METFSSSLFKIKIKKLLKKYERSGMCENIEFFSTPWFKLAVVSNPLWPRPPPFLKLIIKVESIQDFSAAGGALASRCCCDLLRAPVPGCWSRRAGDLGPIPLNQAWLAPPAASQIMTPPLRASACAPAKCNFRGLSQNRSPENLCFRVMLSVPAFVLGSLRQNSG